MNDGWFNPLTSTARAASAAPAPAPGTAPTAKRCWFADYLPDFNFTNAAARTYSVDNAVRWISRHGVDGFRLDAVKHIEPLVAHRPARARSPARSSRRRSSTSTWSARPSPAIATSSRPSSTRHASSTASSTSRCARSCSQHAAHAPGQDARPRSTFMDAQRRRSTARSVMSTFIGNHDVPRTIHFAEDTPLWGDVWADGKDRNWSNQPAPPASTSAYERLASASPSCSTNRGIPLIYYGDEVGMPGAGDPDNRRFMQWIGLLGGQTLLLGQDARSSAPSARRTRRSGAATAPRCRSTTTPGPTRWSTAPTPSTSPSTAATRPRR